MTLEDAWRPKGVNCALYRKGGRRGRRKWRTEKWRGQRGRWGTSIKSSPEGKEDISEGRSVLRDRATSFMIKGPLVGLSFLIKVSDLKLRIHDGKRVGRVVSRYKEKQSRDGLTSFKWGEEEAWEGDNRLLEENGNCSGITWKESFKKKELVNVVDVALRSRRRMPAERLSAQEACLESVCVVLCFVLSSS